MEINSPALRNLYETDPNIVRAVWASRSIKLFMEMTGTDLEDAVADLLCDLMHYCNLRKDDVDFDAELDRARGHYKEELKDG